MAATRASRAAVPGNRCSRQHGSTAGRTCLHHVPVSAAAGRRFTLARPRADLREADQEGGADARCAFAADHPAKLLGDLVVGDVQAQPAAAGAALGGEEGVEDALAHVLAHAAAIGLECHAGHGLTYGNTRPVAAIGEIVEPNIGHFLVGEALAIGLPETLRRMREVMEAGRRDLARPGRHG